ncbi:trypsin-like peptidase domain-containing protein [Nocardioides sp. QY071]|uniref:S1C family serine protease n=1 Tax=Nocardioides sp. QY071 TaxID=3044187 RepID=UPI00249A7A49|nr:trypsin-like peptidase domain-containing protein [Nocardioides sp. QY071]WGY00254.1 trypsin-like peptidase domain-containing protein [Nocardioides sp. QY071]
MTRHPLALGTAALLLVATGAGGAAVATHLLADEAAPTSSAATTQVPTTPEVPSTPYVRRQSYVPGATGRDTADATDEQSTGVVEISSTLTNGTSAGTGLVLDSDGTIVTNHHVVEGATAIAVTVVTTARTYTARYVGANATTDVAVLQLEDASGLTPVDLSDTAAAVGDEITSVGDAGGDGGSLTASPGTVAALHDDITVESTDGSPGGTALTDLIRMDAYVVPGDSGGAVLDADGEVVGMNVAASSGTSDVTGYAIPVATVERVVAQIESGDTGSGVELGYDGYLGVALDPSAGAPLVAEVTHGSAAASAGIAAGDTITRVDGTAVGTTDELRAAISAHAAGDRVTVTWTTATGSNESATVTLGEAPVS